jgi:hypothetical protein
MASTSIFSGHFKKGSTAQTKVGMGTSEEAKQELDKEKTVYHVQSSIFVLYGIETSPRLWNVTE